jgi:predicted RNA-binding Zn-ribbon protein involved in translation (DUF1610 family)
MPINMRCPSCNRTLAAPDSAVGKKAKCPQCGTLMIVPEPIHEAEDAGAPGAAPPPTEEYSMMDDVVGTGPAAPPPGSAGAGPPRRPCPMCGEMIVATAAKCRFCGAVFDPTLRTLQAKKKAAADDADLTPGDWVFCILCAGIACIFGIVYAIQGKPKGLKMIGVSIAAAVVWNILNALLQVATAPHGVR